MITHLIFKDEELMQMGKVSRNVNQVKTTVFRPEEHFTQPSTNKSGNTMARNRSGYMGKSKSTMVKYLNASLGRGESMPSMIGDGTVVTQSIPNYETESFLTRQEQRMQA